MFSSTTWIFSAVALCALVSAAPDKTPAAAGSATAEVKEVPAGAHYGGNGGYGGPSYSQPQYPVFQFPNFDVNYCSVHASFPLVGLDKRHHRDHHRGGNRNKRQSSYGVPSQDQPSTGYSNPSYDSSSSPSYGPPAFFHQRPRHFERQGCRNTAIYSRTSCHSCCQIASRASGNTAPVVGLLLTFDPKLSADKKHHKKDEDLNSPDRALQCVCCTSRRV